MTELEIKDLVSALVTAISANDDAAGVPAAVALVGSAVVDLNRIANALEKITSPPAS